jgi:hypothetical protein
MNITIERTVEATLEVRDLIRELRPAFGLQYLASSTPEMPADQAGGNDERDAPD